jgi:rare lipoprotein A (peptidoglycan hydrolase)
MMRERGNAVAGARMALWGVLLALAMTPASGTERLAAENTVFVTQTVKVHREVGLAAFYHAAGPTASGLKLSHGMTAAHRKLPFGSKVRVKDMKTGREVTVVITDRGPFTKGRVIDLAHPAAQKLGIIGRGIAMVELVAE